MTLDVDHLTWPFPKNLMDPPLESWTQIHLGLATACPSDFHPRFVAMILTGNPAHDFVLEDADGLIADFSSETQRSPVRRWFTDVVFIKIAPYNLSYSLTDAI